MDFTTLKKRLDSYENVELNSEDDIAFIGKSKVTDSYLFIFNAKCIFALKGFKGFSKRIKQKVEQYNLVEVEANE